MKIDFENTQEKILKKEMLWIENINKKEDIWVVVDRPVSIEGCSIKA